jgi:hypothetical protein
MRMLAAAFLFAAGPVYAQAQPDSSLYTPKMEVRFAISNISLRRAVSLAGAGDFYGNGNLNGIEAMIMGARGGGLRARYETGTIGGGSAVPSAGKFENLVGSLIMGRHEFALVGGYRVSTMLYNGQRHFHMPELGVEGGKHFAGAGTLLKGAVSYRRMISEDKVDSLLLSGVEARTSVLYVPPKGPLYIELGYRRDVTRFQKPDNIVVRREEASAVILTIGLQTGLSVR